MKIMFIHLSDMHIKDKNGINRFQIGKIADALAGIGQVDSAVVIVSGDIAFSGKYTEYSFAGKCINSVIYEYKIRSGFMGYIPLLCVPGNHDNDYSKIDEMIDSKRLQSIRNENKYDSFIPSQLKMQEAFFAYAANGAHCDWSGDKQLRRLVYDFLGYKIEVNLLNSGIFSCLEEDKGLHYISQSAINSYNEPSGADFVVTIMHHAPEWFTDSIKHQIEDSIYEKSSLVFLGHEHYIENKKVSYESAPYALIQAGGILCNNDDWQNSSFFAGVLDTETYTYIQYKFNWNTHQKQYEQLLKQDIHIASKPSIEKKLSITDAFMQSFVHDIKHEHLSKDFRDYFVFPRIQEQNPEGELQHEFVTEEAFVSEINDKKRILICSGYNSGKTTLLKSLFLYYWDHGYYPLFCSIENVHGTNTERMIRLSFEDIYGSNQSDYIRYQQYPKMKKVVIVDDLDLIPKKSFDLFLHELRERFENIILATKKVFDFDLIDRAKSILDIGDSVYHYSILPFYSDKREELIRKVVTIKADDPLAIEKTTKLLTTSITLQRRSIILDPDFIINYAEYFCNNVGEVSNSDSSVFSKVFEANITNALSPFCDANMSVDKLYVVIGRIAFFIHFNKAYPIRDSAIADVIKDYNDKYGETVSVKRAIDSICRSKIMIEEIMESGETVYRFSTRNYLAYFVAREVNRLYNIDRNESNLRHLLQYACFGINADILLFISYITDNIQVLRAMLDMAVELTKEWEEFDFVNNIPQYLRASKYEEVLPPEKEEYKHEKEAEIEAEKKQYELMKVSNIYDYTEERAEELSNQLIRACSLLMIVAKCLPGFGHNMLRQDKENFVRMIYVLPNKIFGKWASITDQAIGELIDYLCTQGHDYYRRHSSTSNDEVLRALQTASLSLLLDLYNMAAYHSSRENTQAYLSGFDYSDKSTYGLEHLMMVERVRQTGIFTREALEMDEIKGPSMLKVAIAYIVRHAMVFIPDFEPSQMDQLSSKFFPAKDAKSKILSQRLQLSTSKKRD